MKGISAICTGFRIFLVAMIMFVWCERIARPATFITATLTVTNAPTVNGNALTVLGVAHTFTNNITANPSIFVATNAAIGGSATNLYKHLAAYPISGTSQTRMSATNVVVISGGADEALTASISAGWATLVMSTNTSTNTYPVRTPVYATSDGTNVISLLTKDIGEKATNAIAATAVALGNFVNTSTAQTVAGAKNFSGALNITNASTFIANGVISNVYMTNMQSIGVTNAYIASLQAGGLTLTNTAPLILWNETDAAANEKYAIMQSSTLGGVAGMRLTLANDTLSGFTTAFAFTRSGNSPLLFTINAPLQPNSIQNTTITNTALTNCTAGFTGGYSTGETITNASIAGTLVSLTGGYLSGSGATNLTTTNTTFTATNTWTGDLRFTRANNTALAAGDNAAVDLGTKVVVKLKAGPAGVFAICGIAGGADGRLYKVINATGQDLTIKNESGGDPTPANRIKTNTGADVAITGFGAFEVCYDSEDSRWVLMNSAP